jgi:hypothetical protein
MLISPLRDNPGQRKHQKRNSQLLMEGSYHVISNKYQR